jgi:phage/plasmid-associated DNA primase
MYNTMSPPQTLSLTLERPNSFLDEKTFLEIIPQERIKAILKSEYLLLTWGDESLMSQTEKYIAKNYKNEKELINKYHKKYNTQLGGIPVKYIKPKHKWGRVFPVKSQGLTCFRRKLRNTFIKGNYYDFDLVNAQPDIIRLLCESNQIKCPIIQRYCKNRESLLLEVQTKYNVDRKKAKELFIRMCFYGTFYGWCEDNNIVGIEPLDFINLYQRELQDICLKAKKANPTLYETARSKKKKEGKTSETDVLGSFFGLFNQEQETLIIEQIIIYLINNTNLTKYPETKLPCLIYEYDGIKLLKSNVDMFDGGVEGVLDLLTKMTFELTGFSLKWDEKPIEEFFDIEELIKEVKEDEKPNDDLISDMKEISSALENSDCGVIETVMKIKPDHYILSVDKQDGSKGDWYGWNEKRWEKSDAPLKRAIMYLVPEYWRSIMEKWDNVYEDMVFEEGEEPSSDYLLWKRTKKKMIDRIFQLKSSTGITSCVSVAKTLLANYKLEFDSKVDLFGTENGVIDIENGISRPYDFNDHITFSCGFNYTCLLPGFKVIDENGDCRTVSVDECESEEFSESYELIQNTFKQIFPDDELREYVFKVFSTGLSGRAIEKFFVFNGSGRNGKGLTNEFLEKVFGSYYTGVSAIIFSENQKNKSSSSANPEIAKLDKKRWIVSKEPQKDAPLHNNVIKDLTGGGNTSARMLYSSKTDVKLCGTYVMECNEKPPFSEAPQDADAERINDILFGSFFTADDTLWDINTGEKNNCFPLETGLKDTLKSSTVHKNTMLNILLNSLLLVKAQNYNVDFFKPDSVKLRSQEYLQNSYDIHNIFKVIFEKRNIETATNDKYLDWKGGLSNGDNDWTLTKIAMAIRKSSDFGELTKRKQKEYSCSVIEGFFQKNRIYKKDVYKNNNTHAFQIKNWRLKPVEQDAETDDDN